MIRRFRVFAVLTAALSTAGVLMVATPASAVSPITGHLVDEVNNSIDVAGMTVQLWTISAGSPDAMVDSDVSGSGGMFSLDPGSASNYFVHVVAGKWQGGWVGLSGGQTYAQNGPADATIYHPGDNIGMILDPAAFMRGYVVRSGTTNRLAGVHITSRSSTDISQVEAADDTDARGTFYAAPISCEDDCYVKVNGSAIGYETGFVACNGSVVATWGDACAVGPGAIGKVKLDHL